MTKEWLIAHVQIHPTLPSLPITAKRLNLISKNSQHLIIIYLNIKILVKMAWKTTSLNPQMRPFKSPGAEKYICS